MSAWQTEQSVTQLGLEPQQIEAKRHITPTRSGATAVFQFQRKRDTSHVTPTCSVM